MSHKTRYKVELITAESEASRYVRHRLDSSPEELLMGMEWAARQFYSLPSIVERMWKSKTGLWWNIIRNVGYHLALRNFRNVGYNPEYLTSESAHT